MNKPATGTREWADRTYNIQAGCEHACAYCYAHAMAVRFGRCERARDLLAVLTPRRLMRLRANLYHNPKVRVCCRRWKD